MSQPVSELGGRVGGAFISSVQSLAPGSKQYNMVKLKKIFGLQFISPGPTDDASSRFIKFEWF